MKRDSEVACLTEEGQRYLADILTYLRLKQMDEGELEAVADDLKAMFWEAQQRGEGPQQVLGRDFRAFCDDILAGAGRKRRRAVLCDWADTVLLGLLLLVGLDFLFSGAIGQAANALLHGSAYDWRWAITAGDLRTWGVLAAAVAGLYLWVGRTPLAERGTTRRTLSFGMGAGVMVLCLALAAVGRFLLPHVLFHPPLWGLAAALLLGYLAHRALCRLSR